MGGHDAELILIAGALLAAGIVGALLADRVRIPGLLLFLGLGMLAGSEGIGGIEFDDTELARTLGTIALVLILFEGGLTAGWSEIRPVLGTAASLATVGTWSTAADRRPRRALDLRHQRARRDDRRRRDRRHRLGRDLRGAAPLDPREAAGALARGRVGDERPGRPAARDRLHRMDPGARLRARRHGRPAGAQTGDRDRGRRSPWAGSRSPPSTGCGCRPTGIYPVATIAIAGLAYGLAEVAHGSGLLAVYLTALALGTARIPARRTIVAFHEGVGWVAQIGLFILLGLLVFPSALDDVAWESLALSAVLILVARPSPPCWRRSSRRSTCASGRCSAGPGCAVRRRSGWRPSRSSPGSAPARSCSRSSSSSSSPRPWSRAPASSRWRGGSA